MITSAKAQFDNVSIQNLTTNPKALYRYMTQKSKIKTLVGPLEKPDESLIDDDSEVVDALNKLFSDLYLLRKILTQTQILHLKSTVIWMRFILPLRKYTTNYPC